MNDVLPEIDKITSKTGINAIKSNQTQSAFFCEIGEAIVTHNN